MDLGAVLGTSRDISAVLSAVLGTGVGTGADLGTGIGLAALRTSVGVSLVVGAVVASVRVGGGLHLSLRSLLPGPGEATGTSYLWVLRSTPPSSLAPMGEQQSGSPAVPHLGPSDVDTMQRV